MSRMRQLGVPSLSDFGFGNPTAFGLPPPTVADQLPRLTPEEQGSILGSALETGIGGLGYLGKLLDKPGRAVRGGLNMLLGGDTPVSELASFLPFSDTLGLTQERNAVQGTDLNAQAGLTTKGDDSLWNMGAGLATEVATDPLTLLQFGALTKAGKVLAKTGAGQLPKGLAPKLAGNLVDEAAVQSRNPLGRTRDLLQPGETLLTNEAVAKAAEQGVPLAAGQPLASMFALGVPGFEPFAQWGTGQTAQRAAGLLDAAKAGVASAAPVRAVRAAFDPGVGGAYVRGAQQVAEDTLRPEVRALQRDAATQYTKLQQRADPFLEAAQAGAGGVNREQAVADVMRQAAEFQPNPAVPYAVATHPTTGRTLRQQAYQDALNAGFDRKDAVGMVRLGQDVGDTARQFQKLEADLGIGTGDLLDTFTDYLTRTKNAIPGDTKGGWVSGLKRKFQEFSTTHGSQIAREEMFKDIPGGTVEINRWAKDPALRQMNDAQRAAYFREQLTGMPTPSSVPGVNEKANSLAKWVGGLPEAHVTEGIDFFRTDPLADFYLRGKRSAQARGSTEAVFDGVSRFARPTSDFVALGQDHVPVADVLKQLNLDTSRSLGGQTPARNIIADRLAASPAGMSVPADMARDLVKLGQAYGTAPELAPLMQGWNGLTNLFKAYVTTPFPAFHTRNLMSGAFNAWRDDAFSLGAWQRGKQFMRGEDADLSKVAGYAALTPEQRKQALVQELVAGNVALTKGSGRGGDVVNPSLGGLIARAPDPAATGNTVAGDFGRLLMDSLPGDVGKSLRTEGRLPTGAEFGKAANPLNIQGVKGEEDAVSFIREGRKVQSAVDDWIGVSHYLAKREAGFDPEAAALAVKKYQNDYLDLTSTERNIMKAVMPWYSFSRRTLPPLLEDLATKPGKVAGSLRAVSGVRDPFEFVPGYVAEGASVPLGTNEDGSKRYISSFGLPFEDESIKALGSALHGDAGRTVQSVLGMGVPQLKGLIELGTGQQLYSGRKLEDLRPAEYLSAAGLFDEDVNRKLTQFVNNSPLSRTASSVDRFFFDPRKGATSSAINALTGVRVADVDVEKARAVAGRDALAELLRGEPGVKASSSIYVPQASLPLLDPETAKVYAAYRAAQAEMQKKARQRAEAAGGR